MEMDEMATNLDILQELDKRGALDEEMTIELERLKAKEKGLEIVLEQLKKYGKEHWFYMTNVSLDHYNILNCDLLVATSVKVYTLEINYYDGVFEFKNKESFLNGRKIEEHPIQMAQSVTSQLKSIGVMSSVPIKVDVAGAAVFPNPDSKIRIHDEVDDIEIIPSKQLVNFIKRIAQEEMQKNKKRELNSMLFSWVGRIDRHHPCWQIKIPDEIKDNIQLGITCSHCESFDLKIGEDFVSCVCGQWESLEEATVRTICDYGVLNNDKDLHPLELYDFFGGQVSLEYIEACLERHFTPVGLG
jgi:hypothetical protein